MIMKVTKLKETFIIIDPPDSKVLLDVKFKEQDFEITRCHVETGSTIVEFAQEMAVELLKKDPV